jgi:hypothetical protein
MTVLTPYRFRNPTLGGIRYPSKVWDGAASHTPMGTHDCLNCQRTVFIRVGTFALIIVNRGPVGPRMKGPSHFREAGVYTREKDIRWV